MKAYKLFRRIKSRPGELFPLFIDRSTPVPVGDWVEARFVPTPGYAPRPGWHVAPAPNAPHLCRKDGTLALDRVWAEVEIPDEPGPWQAIADAAPTGDIRDQVPTDGFYTFKRPANQGGSWMIAGRMKVVRVLEDTNEEEATVTKREQRDKANAERVNFAKPVSVRATAKLLREAKLFEWGSWEDHGEPDDDRGDAHPKVIFERRKGVLQVWSVAEIRNVISSLENSADITADQAECAEGLEKGNLVKQVQAFERMTQDLRAQLEKLT